MASDTELPFDEDLLAAPDETMTKEELKAFHANVLARQRAEWSKINTPALVLTAANLRIEQKSIEAKLKMLDSILIERMFELGEIKIEESGFGITMMTRDTTTISQAALVAQGFDLTDPRIVAATKTTTSDPYLVFFAKKKKKADF